MKILGTTEYKTQCVKDLIKGQIGEVVDRPDLVNVKYIVRINSTTCVAFPKCELWEGGVGNLVTIRILRPNEQIILIQE